ncbi:MAG: tRNA1(Val) (adenine(37)-N6)-methyltransferase [Bacilli bacterium]|nr:tRNA1(Val) (adenine(37)-N6)-methyltransferase [Bacilli bacterium]
MEQLDDVLGYELKIYQRRDWFSFSLDSVLLANFLTVKKTTKKILDLGTGNGIIPLILSLRTKSKIYGVDIQQDLIDLALKSVDYNNLSNQIELFCMDMKELLNKKSLYNTYDIIVSNPPYFTDFNLTKKNDDVHKTIARHEVKISLRDIFLISNRLLKDGGTFSIINRTDRLVEILNLFKEYGIEPKRIRFVYKDILSNSNMVYVEGIKSGKPYLKVDSPFIIYNSDGTPTKSYESLCKEVL